MTQNIHFKIEGGYQYKAYYQGICFQRSWHVLKFDKALELLNVKNDDKILDAACGSGVLTHLITEKTKADITAVDFNEGAIAFCNNQYTIPTARFLQLDLNERFFQENSFDKVVMLEVLEHLPKEVVSSILSNLYYYLKPGGIFVLSTPNKKSPWPVIEFVLDSFGLTPKMKNEQHVKLYKQSTLRKVLEEAGFRIKRIDTTHFLAPWLSFLGMKVAKKIHAAEQKAGLRFGSLLFAVAEK
jgi:2-polyprenyl-3-methyl-5-hydroxy-6-metoxy-1,4-benzoquinol methylase